MPRAFKIYPKHPAVAALVKLHADIGGRLKANRDHGARLANDMRHVEAVIRMFDPAFDVRGIALRRRNRENPWFKRGTVYREALNVLRDAEAPMSAREIAQAMLAAKGVKNVPTRQISNLGQSILSSMRNHKGSAVVVVGEGAPSRWVLAERRR